MTRSRRAIVPAAIVLALLVPAPARAAGDDGTLVLAPTGEYVSIRDGLADGQGVPVRPGGTLTITAPRHVDLSRLDLELITFRGEQDAIYTPAELRQTLDADAGRLTVTFPEELATTPVDEAYLAPTEESVPVFGDGWEELTGEFAFVGLEVGLGNPEQVTHALVSRLFLETRELSGRDALRPGQKVRLRVPEGDPVLSLLGRIDLSDARVELSPFSDHAAADGKKLAARTSADGLSLTFTVPRGFPAGDSSLGVVATDLGEPTIEALQWTTRTSVTRQGPPAQVGVARATASGALVFHLATAHRDGGGEIRRIEFGRAGDVPLAGDWDGDGHDGIGVYRPAEQAFYLRADAGAGRSVVRRVKLGSPGDVPVTGRFGTDPARSTVGVYSPATGRFLLAGSNRDGGGEVTRTGLRAPGDLAPLAGDWDGDGTATVGVHRPAGATFELLGGREPVSLHVGRPLDLPVTGDWDGDGLTDVGVRRHSSARFVLAGPSDRKGSPQLSFTFGRPDDLPFSWTP